MAFQNSNLLPWRNLWQNILFPFEIRRQDSRPHHERIRELLRLTGLAGFEDRYPHELSGGMRQRVAVARTWAANPDVILMDEPFAAVDAMTRLTLQEELARLCAQTRKTVFFITHSVDEAVFLGDRVLVMTRRPGVIKAEVVLVSKKADTDAMRWVYLDIGKFGGLAETMDEAIRYPIRTARDGDEMEPVVLAGPTCDSADVLYEKLPYDLPISLTVGDEGGQETFAAQDDAEHLGQRWVVIDDEYPGSHAIQYCTVPFKPV